MKYEASEYTCAHLRQRLTASVTQNADSDVLMKKVANWKVFFCRYISVLLSKKAPYIHLYLLHRLRMFRSKKSVWNSGLLKKYVADDADVMI